jgi:hypothetical protein
MAATLIGQKIQGGAERQALLITDQTVYQVTAAISDPPSTILAAVPIAEGDFHPDPVFAAAGVTCRKVKPDRAEPGVWDVTVDWSNAPQTEQEKEASLSPLARKTQWDGIVKSKTIPRGKNRDDTPQRNTAKDPFDPPLTDTKYGDQLRFTVNLPSLPSWYQSLRNKINQDSVYIGGKIATTFPPRTLLFIPEGVSPQPEENGVEFVAVKFLLDIEQDGWDEEVLDAGIYYNDEGGEGLGDLRDKKAFVDKDGEPTKVPQYLNGTDGQKSTDGPHYITSEYKQETSFADLAAILNNTI